LKSKTKKHEAAKDYYQEGYADWNYQILSKRSTMKK
jgi:hypothetical protein